MHRAIDLNSVPDAYLFPVRTDHKPASPARKVAGNLRFVNRLIGENPQQAIAVERIVCGERKEAAYLVFGPPGTGKTVTIVEAMVQVRWKMGSFVLGLTSYATFPIPDLDQLPRRQDPGVRPVQLCGRPARL